MKLVVFVHSCPHVYFITSSSWLPNFIEYFGPSPGGGEKLSGVTNKSVVYFRPTSGMGGRIHGRRGQFLHKVSHVSPCIPPVTDALLEATVQLNMAPASDVNSPLLAALITAATVWI